MINDSLSFSDLKIEFILDDTSYDAEDFKMSLDRPDPKIRFKEDLNTGRFEITLFGMPNSNLILWSKKPTLTKSGGILFKSLSGEVVYTIRFSNAYCLVLTNEMGINIKTRLKIAPESFSLNDIEYNNHWHK